MVQIVPVSRLNKEHRAVINLTKNAPVHLTAHGEEVAIVVSSAGWQLLMEQLEELEDLRDILAAYKAEIEIWEGREQLEDLDTDQLQVEIDDAKVPA